MAEISSGIKITDVRVSNFRSLKNVEVPLDNLTILIGANNAGKTSFLDALYAAIGAGRRLLGQDDVRLEAGEALPPKERVVTVDVRIRPVGEDGGIAEHFPEGGFWTGLWGAGIMQDMDDDFREFVGIRTTLAWSPSKGDYVVERRFLKEWRGFADWLFAPAEEKTRVAANQIEPLALHYIDAKRDLEDDLRRQGSFWRRMTEDLGLSDADVAAFESALSDLNQEIVGKSEILKHLKENLVHIQSVVSAEGGGIDISPVARKLRDLSKGVDVSFSAAGSQAFPLTRHGMGTRSLASLLVFRAFAAWKGKQADEAGDHIHSLLALEEPEAHLHPQAQRSFFTQVKSIPGQRIVSTHSPYFAGQAGLSDLRLFIRRDGETTVSKLDLSKLNADEVRKLRHGVVNTRGDLLFARAAVFFEGETEEQALPILAEAYWKCSIHELGFSFVRVGGAGSYFPFIWLAERLNIPWYVFSDGEPQPLNHLERALHNAGKPKAEACPNVVVIPGERNFETQLVAEGYLPEIEAVFDQVKGMKGFLDDYIARLDGKSAKGGVTRDYKAADGRLKAACDALAESKTRMAEPLASMLTSLPDEGRRFPTQIRALFEKISEDHGLVEAGKEKS
jgi:putative ATP-dependent endonuclease of OLD family